MEEEDLTGQTLLGKLRAMKLDPKDRPEGADALAPEPSKLTSQESEEVPPAPPRPVDERLVPLPLASSAERSAPVARKMRRSVAALVAAGCGLAVIGAIGLGAAGLVREGMSRGSDHGGRDTEPSDGLGDGLSDGPLDGGGPATVEIGPGPAEGTEAAVQRADDAAVPNGPARRMSPTDACIDQGLRGERRCAIFAMGLRCARRERRFEDADQICRRSDASGLMCPRVRQVCRRLRGRSDAVDRGEPEPRRPGVRLRPRR